MKRWLMLVLKIGSVLTTFGLPALIAYGLASPWRVAEDALSEHRGSPKLLVGVAYERSSIDGRTSETTSHTYIIWPAALQSLATVEVTEDERGVHVQTQRFGVLEVAFAFLLGLFGFWWFFIRRGPPKSRAAGRP
jgi:hypothetical protein